MFFKPLADFAQNQNNFNLYKGWFT